MTEKNILIGNIIINNLLCKSPQFINRVIYNELFLLRNLESEHNIIFKKFHNIDIIEKEIKLNQLIGKIGIHNDKVHLIYNLKYLAGVFYYNNSYISYNFIKDIKYNDLQKVLFRFRRINYINRLTYFISNALLNLQKEFFITENELKIKLVLLKNLRDYILHYYNFDVDISLISRFIKNKIFLTTTGKKIPLTFLCSNKRFVYTTSLADFFYKESKLILNKKIKKPFSDEKISNILREKYKIEISRRQIANYRKLMGIKSIKDRKIMDSYIPEQYKFSPFYKLTRENVKKYCVDSAGVYEIHFINEVKVYNNKPNTLIYIGASKNLKKRLLTHFNGKNKILQNYIQEKRCKFRFLLLKKDYRNVETILLLNFTKIYSKKPYCNSLLTKNKGSDKK